MNWWSKFLHDNKLNHEKRKCNQIHRKRSIFAQPILSKIREIVHQACPEIEENLKWSFPHFNYSGKIICSMVHSNSIVHLLFGWQHNWKIRTKYYSAENHKNQWGIWENSITWSKPDENILIRYIHEAINLSQAESRVVRKLTDRTEIKIPVELEAALKNKEVYRKFDQLPYSHRREYVNYITEAKRRIPENAGLQKRLRKL